MPAINPCGTKQDFAVTSTANTGTVSTTITVPPEARLVLVGVSGQAGAASMFTGLTFTKGGVDTAMTRVATQSDLSPTYWQCALFYLNLPDLGPNKTLKWDWAGAGVITDPLLLFSVTFWCGTDKTTPVRDGWGVQATALAAFPLITPPQLFTVGDTAVAFGGFIYPPGNGAGDITGRFNVAELFKTLNNGHTQGAWAKAALDYTAIFSPASPTAEKTDDPNFSYRNVIPLTTIPLTGPVTEVRVSFISSATIGLRTTHCSIGIATGVGSATTTVPVELKFGGASGFFLPGPYQAIISDWAILPATVTGTDSLVVIMDMGATPAKTAFWGGPTGTSFYFKSAAATWNSASDAGFGAPSPLTCSVAYIEERNLVTGRISVGALTCTGTEAALAAVSLIPNAFTPGGNHHMGIA